MRISHVIHVYELIFLLLTNNWKISAAWGKGKYFSDYEYPELKLLFSSKEEENGKDGSQSESSGIVQGKADFALSLGSLNEIPLRGVPDKSANDGKLKPWMRQPFAEAVKVDGKELRNENENIIPKKWNLSGKSSKIEKNTVIGDIPADEKQKNLDCQTRKTPPILLDKERIHIKKNTEDKLEARKHMQIRKTLNKLKFHNQEKGLPDEEDGIKLVKSPIDSSEHFRDYNLPSNGNKYSYHNNRRRNYGGNYQRSKNGIKKKNFNINIDRGSINSPEYEGSFQEYEELGSNKNEAVVINENLLANLNNSKPIVQPVARVTQDIVWKYQAPALINEKDVGTNMPNFKNTRMMPIVADPSKSEELVYSGITNRPANNQITASSPNAMIPLVLKEESGSKGMSDYSDVTSSFLLPIPDKNVVVSNTSKSINVPLRQNEISFPAVIRGPALQENKQLLAKPPVKIANTLSDKHSEEEIDNVGDKVDNVQEQGGKVKLLNSVTNPSPVPRFPGTPQYPSQISGNDLAIKNKALQIYEKNDVFSFINSQPLSKTKRNIGSSNFLVPCVQNQTGSINNIQTHKSSNIENNLGFVEQDVEREESPVVRNSKLTEPEFYSLSKGNSPLKKLAYFVERLEPFKTVKKSKEYEEKVNDSVKRSAPQIYDHEYQANYDYYTNKNNKEAIPLQSYYDYDNEYDSEEDNSKDFTRNSGLNNNGALALDREESNESNDVKDTVNQVPKNIKKFKKHNSKKTEAYNQDIFAHPLSLDDPELQIVRDEENELVNRHSHSKNSGTRQRKTKLGRHHSVSHLQGGLGQEDVKLVEQEPPIRAHMRKKKKGEFKQYSRYSKPQSEMKKPENCDQPENVNEESKQSGNENG